MLSKSIICHSVVVIGAACTSLLAMAAGTTVGGYTLVPGHESLQEWLLPEIAPYPEDNAPTDERIELGRMLFFDPRLSGDGNMSCASCHNPMLGWSDGLPVARGHRGQLLRRATQSIINSGFNFQQTWDGRSASLEDQAIGPMGASTEMNSDLDALFVWLKNNDEYRAAFQGAYPGEPIDKDTLAKAIASFERTITVRDTPFDRWVAGEAAALTDQQVRGFAVFLDEDRGNCVVCHSAPNFTDDGFHNLGLASWGRVDRDEGRYTQKPIERVRGAFKTSSLRHVAHTAPYFHDGSAATLMEVVRHYERGGVVKTHLSDEIRPLKLTAKERAELLAFLGALSSPVTPITVPALPLDGPVTTERRRKEQP